MPGRTIAIGDVHGCFDALKALVEAVAPGADDTLIPLGDYIDRGPDSCGVLGLLITLARQCRLIPLLGNHEELLLQALDDRDALKRWLTFGGAATLQSYGWVRGAPRRSIRDWIPPHHRDFLESCKPYHETDSHLFLHAGFVPELPMDQQPAEALRWRVTSAGTTRGHNSGKVAVVGHTPQWTGEVLDLGSVVCIDTNCVRGGWLTALDVTTGEVWQADRDGRLRQREE